MLIASYFRKNCIHCIAFLARVILFLTRFPTEYLFVWGNSNSNRINALEGNPKQPNERSQISYPTCGCAALSGLIFGLIDVCLATKICAAILDRPSGACGASVMNILLPSKVVALLRQEAGCLAA